MYSKRILEDTSTIQLQLKRCISSSGNILYNATFTIWHLRDNAVLVFNFISWTQHAKAPRVVLVQFKRTWINAG